MVTGMRGRDLYGEDFTALRASLADDPTWLSRHRKEAMDQFSHVGFPNSHDE